MTDDRPGEVDDTLIDLAAAFRRRLAHLKPLEAGRQPTRDGLVDTLGEERPVDHVQ